MLQWAYEVGEARRALLQERLGSMLQRWTQPRSKLNSLCRTAACQASPQPESQQGTAALPIGFRMQNAARETHNWRALLQVSHNDSWCSRIWIGTVRAVHSLAKSLMILGIMMWQAA